MRNITIIFNMKEAQHIAKAAAEGATGLPFGLFGATGGGGPLRWKLVRAINAEDWSVAQQTFNKMVHETVCDIIYNLTEDSGAPVPYEAAKDQFISYLWNEHPQWLGWAA